jgi:hypothetical protein
MRPNTASRFAISSEVSGAPPGNLIETASAARSDDGPVTACVLVRRNCAAAAGGHSLKLWPSEKPLSQNLLTSPSYLLLELDVSGFLNGAQSSSPQTRQFAGAMARLTL